MHIHFILVEPAVPENIGASARAIKTMGFTSLKLVNPVDHLDKKAMMLAHGSHDVLKNASLHNELKEAVQDTDLIIGTTAKRRKTNADYCSIHELKDFITKKKQTINSTAIVFGREESGLNNKELQLCDIVSSVPIKAPYPSINLAQSVMLYAFMLSEMNLEKTSIKHAQTSEMAILKEKLSDTLNKIDIKTGTALHNRIVERAMHAGEADVHIMLSVIARILKSTSK